MVILRTRNKITDFLMILAWASPFNKDGDENIPARLNYINENYEILDQMLNMLAENGYTFYMYTSL